MGWLRWGHDEEAGLARLFVVDVVHFWLQPHRITAPDRQLLVPGAVFNAGADPMLPGMADGWRMDGVAFFLPLLTNN